MPTPTATPHPYPAGTGVLTVWVRGEVSYQERDCAQAMISVVIAHHRRFADHPRVRISGAACPADPA